MASIAERICVARLTTLHKAAKGLLPISISLARVYRPTQLVTTRTDKMVSVSFPISCRIFVSFLPRTNIIIIVYRPFSMLRTGWTFSPNQAPQTRSLKLDCKPAVPALMRDKVSVVDFAKHFSNIVSNQQL